MAGFRKGLRLRLYGFRPRLYSSFTVLYGYACHRADPIDNMILGHGAWSRQLQQHSTGVGCPVPVATPSPQPGWVTTGPPGSSIEFDLAFGPSPRATLVYDSSYEGFGKVALSLSGQKRQLMLDALRRSGPRVTQTEVLALNLKLGTHGFAAVRPHAPNATLRLTLLSEPPLKFKVRHLSSC